MVILIIPYTLVKRVQPTEPRLNLTTKACLKSKRRKSKDKSGGIKEPAIAVDSSISTLSDHQEQTQDQLNQNHKNNPTILKERRQKILDLNKIGKTMRQISQIIGVAQTTVLRDLGELKKDGFTIANNRHKYLETLRASSRWIPIITRTNEELNFYKIQGIVPTLRKMLYRLLELGVLQKKDYNDFAKKTAEARRGVKDDYETPTNLPKLPIDCFKDDTRILIGETDMHQEPEYPTPAQPPQDWEEYIQDAIDTLKEAPGDYDGKREEGEGGEECGRWYKQPKYVEIWCESETIKLDLQKFQEDRHVQVIASGGQVTTSYMFTNATRIKETISKYDHIKEVVILYFGDSDKAGENIAFNHERALRWYIFTYLKIPRDRIKITFKVVAVTREQIRKYKLIENPEKKYNVQLEAFLTTEKLLKIFKKIVCGAIDEEWNEDIYSENCPDKEYDYEANGEEEPESIDPNGPDPNDPDSNLTIREKMIRKINDAFYPGWESNLDN